MNSLATLKLGGNGIWGDLLNLNAEDIRVLSEHLSDYKLVAGALTKAYPRITGLTGSSPEIYEKIDHESASGIVVFFTVAECSTVYVTERIAVDRLQSVKGADSWEVLPDGRVKLTVNLDRNDARPVYFLGVEN